MNGMLLGMWILLLALFFGAPVRAEESIFRVRLVEDLATLDWNYGEVNPEVIYQIMEGLFRAGPKGEPENAVVRSFRWNLDKTELRLRLKKKKWSDGQPVCAEDFVRSWKRLLDKDFASPYAHYGHVLKDFSAKGCDTLNVVFQRPTPEAPALFSHYVFFPLRESKELKTDFLKGDSLLVNGPFRVKEWTFNNRLVLERNKNYVGKRAMLATVEFLFLAEDNTAKVLFEQGKLDWMRDVSVLLRNSAMEKSSEFRIYPSYTSYYFGLNEKSALLKNIEIRKALNASLDRSEIGKVLGRECRGVWSSAPRSLMHKFEEVARPPVNFQNVKQWLKEAEAQGKMDLVLRVYNKSAHKLLAEWAQGQWQKKLGVRIPIEIQEGKVYWKEIGTKPAPIFLSGITLPFGHPRGYYQEFLSTSTANWTGWSDLAYDRAVNDGRFRDSERILQENAFVIPLYQRDSVALVKAKWKGFMINPLGQTFLVDVH